MDYQPCSSHMVIIHYPLNVVLEWFAKISFRSFESLIMGDTVLFPSNVFTFDI